MSHYTAKVSQDEAEPAQDGVAKERLKQSQSQEEILAVSKPLTIAERPSGVEIDPSNNVPQSGRKKYHEFHKDVSQSSIQQHNLTGNEKSISLNDSQGIINIKLKNTRKINNSRRFKSTLNKTAKNQESNFSLYGLKSSKGEGYLESPSIKKLADINKFKAGDAANKFYDKHLIQALDKFS